MSAFDKVIGYETIKGELMQICDMIHNRKIYEDLGAQMPNGVLLYGDPGLGKSLLASCFIEESRLKAYTLRRNKGGKDFVQEITDTFKKAMAEAPAIIFMDDMDKFANEDEKHCDAEEYVAIQAGIDEAKGTDVFVFATANNIRKLPDSLIRSGRFDRKVELEGPSQQDAQKIICHFLKSKKVSDDVNMEDLAMMISYSSCAELETILNEAAILAAFARHEHVEMADIIKAVLRMQYNSPDNFTVTPSEDLQKVALHEAGHLVVCEVLCPGSVGLASVRTTGRSSTGGFIHRCKKLKRRPYHVLVGLAGKAAVELYHAETVASGCQQDLDRAVNDIRNGISYSGTGGFGLLDVESRRSSPVSESFNERSEAVVQVELERHLRIARDILLKNRDFLEKITAALLEKETLLYSDIQAIRNSVTITEIAA